MKNQLKAVAVNLKKNSDDRSETFQHLQQLGSSVGLLTGARYSNPKLERLISQATLLYTASLAAKGLYEIIRKNSRIEKPEPIERRFFVRVYRNDQMYRHVHVLVQSSMVNIPQGHTDELIVKSYEAESFDDMSNAMKATLQDKVPNKNVYIYSEIDRRPEAVFDINGFNIAVHFEPIATRPVVTAKNPLDEFIDVQPARGDRGNRSSAGEMKYNHESYIFECWSQEEREAVLEWLWEAGPKVYHRDDGDETSGYRTTEAFIAKADGGGEWSDVNMRTKETVILPEGEIDMIIEEIRAFQKYEPLYATLGVPYHHGIMLSGAPGTGKSSAAQAIASELGMTTYSASLSTLKDNDALMKFMRNVGRNCVVLLEDIDVAASVQSRTGDNNNVASGVTMEALLQVLDGISSPHGAVFILTTNHLDVLDPAIIRPGRIDATYDITYLIDEQFERLVRKFCMLPMGTPLDLPSVEGLNITPAEIVGVIKKYIPTVEDSIPEIVKFVREKQEALMATV